MTVDDLKEKVVGAYRGTPAALWWSVGDREIYHYETQVGEIIGQGYNVLDDSAFSYVHAQTPGVFERIDVTGGPMTVLSRLCREAGLEFFPRVRMNSHYKVDPASPAYGRFRREHPELLIGRPGEAIAQGSLEWGIRTGLNYAFPQVRAHMAAVIIELFERFDVDGVELDFMRHPTLFRPEEAYSYRYLMTDLLVYVRRRMDEVGAARDRPLRLAVRVPPTLADAARVGLDVAEWMALGLVDIVVVGMGMIPFEMPIEQFVETARDTRCLVYGCIEAARPAVDDDVLRALAYRFWSAGASGVYLYNFFTMGPEWNRRMLNQLADPSALRLLDKRYELDDSSRLTPQGQQGIAGGPFVPDDAHFQIMSAFRNAVPPAQLPLTLQETLTDRGPTLRLEIADDLETAVADGVLGDCSLGLLLSDLMPDQELEVSINGEVVAWSSGSVSTTGWSRTQLEPVYWLRFPTQPVELDLPGVAVEFELGCPSLKQGVNALQVRLIRPDSQRKAPVVLQGVRVTIRYKRGDG